MSCNTRPVRPTPLVDVLDSLATLSAGGWVSESFSLEEARYDVRTLETRQATLAEELRVAEDALAKLPCDGTPETRAAYNNLSGHVTHLRLALAELAVREAYLRAEVERQEWHARHRQAREVREVEARGEKAV